MLEDLKLIEEGLSVSDIMPFLEYENVDFLDAFGEPLFLPFSEILSLKVEKVYATADRVQVQTYHNLDKFILIADKMEDSGGAN